MEGVRYIPVGRVPLWLKLAYSAFMAVLVPVYLRDYGPTNFLYFCDVALLLTLLAVWLDSSLWASTALVGILVAQLIWMVDFLCLGQVTGTTLYMFDSGRFWFTRGLSFFHFWLPVMLVYLVYRLGFDRRSWLTWTAMACPILVVCYFWMPPPPTPPDQPNLPVNINYVFGISDEKKQDLVPEWVWFAALFVVGPFGVWWPTAFILSKLFPPPLVTHRRS